MKIRSYNAGDLDAVLEVFSTSVHTLGAEQYDPQQLAAWAPERPDLALWQSRFGRLTVFLAEIDGQVAGFIGYEPNGHIDFLYTSPRFPRRGVATALYQHAEEVLDARGTRRIFTEASRVARPFFEKQGFEVEKSETVTRLDVSLERFVMHKQLVS